MNAKVYRVCENCRIKKRKCSQERPTCSLCLQRQVPCVYATKRQRPGPEKGTTRKLSRITMPQTGHCESARQSNTIFSITPPHMNQEIPLYVENADHFYLSDAQQLTSSLGVFDIGLSDDDDSQEMMPVLDRHIFTTFEYDQITQADIRVLLQRYFEHIQPTFPLFRRPTFYENYVNGKVPSPLLAIMLALASTFSSDRRLATLTDLNYWRKFMGLEALYSVQASLLDEPATLDDVKTECLLTVYEYTRSPRCRAWMSSGRLTRLAYGCGLHQIDSASNDDRFSEEEREERRYVFWTVFFLDAFSNGIALTPLGIDGQSIRTYLVSTDIERFTEGNILPSSKTNLHVGLRMFEHVLKHVDLEDSLCREVLYTLMTAAMREVITIRCCMAVEPQYHRRDRLSSVMTAMSFVQAALPDWYFNPSCSVSRIESPTDHRIRLETLLQLNTLSIFATLPLVGLVQDDASPTEQLDLQQWQECVASAEKIAKIFQNCNPSFLSLMKPMTCYIPWYTIIILCLESMLAEQDFTEHICKKQRLESGITTLTTSLENIAVYWPVANTLLESVWHIRQWTGLRLMSYEVAGLSKQLLRLLDPKDTNPSHFNLDTIGSS